MPGANRRNKFGAARVLMCPSCGSFERVNGPLIGAFTKSHRSGCGAEVVSVASIAEARYYGGLCRLARAGHVSNLERQPRFDLVVNGVRIGRYTADVRYTDEAGVAHVVDVKGYDTRESRLRRKLVKAIHGVEVEVVKSPRGSP